MLQQNSIKDYGYFNFNAVDKLIAKMKKVNNQQVSARDDMTVVGIVSTQLMHKHFISYN